MKTVKRLQTIEYFVQHLMLKAPIVGHTGYYQGEKRLTAVGDFFYYHCNEADLFVKLISFD